jgi:transposase
MISTYTLNHFGLISGICNELDIRGFIDRLIPVDPQQKVTTGQAVVSMIINGLGFSNRQLYLYPQFFEKKPVELLIDQGICAEDLNDDTIGRALDRVYLYGCTELICYSPLIK